MLLRVSRSRIYYESNPRPKTANPIAHHERNIARLTQEHVDKILAQLDANPQSSVDDVFYNAYNHGAYIASLSSFYRIARKHNRLLKHRNCTSTKRRSKRGNNQPPHVVATAPAQVLCWDITFLPGPFVNENYACHTIIDLYSRAVIGTLVTHREDARGVSKLFDDILTRYPTVQTVHSDNGAAMRSNALKRVFAKHDVDASFSRPATSNDNPQMESLFHTMKGFAYYPKAFANIDAATRWVARFTRHYNNRPHSGINGYTPQSVLDGTWKQYETNRINAARAALEAGLITAMPKTPTGLPKEVTIIRTTTKTRPQSPTLTVA